MLICIYAYAIFSAQQYHNINIEDLSGVSDESREVYI